jgi:REP element-mobilizing transposase RayT
MAHVSRPEHKARFPLLITSRLCPGLPSLRHEREAACIRRALAAANGTAARDPGSAPFQVVHHSIQSNHLHLIVEADDRASLTSGMRGMLVRIARALNRLWKRYGPVFADRFHERELRNPLQVRTALVYVLQNLRKHGIALAGPDPLSSGPEFDGWSSEWNRDGDARADPRPRFGAELAAPGGLGARSKAKGSPLSGGATSAGASAFPGAASMHRAARAEVPQSITWLLGVGWKKHGLIDPRESPRRQLN